MLIFTFFNFMCVCIPTHLAFNPSYSILVVVQFFLTAPKFVDNLKCHDFLQLYFNYCFPIWSGQYVFWKPHTYLIKPTHVCGLPHMSESFKYVGIPTHMWSFPNMCKLCNVCGFHQTCVVNTTYVWVLHMCCIGHTCVGFTTYV